jgi:flavin-dependent dehydrogenase
MEHKQIKYDCDLGIIGGGLAGLTLAIQAANAGYRVLLFEKETYPFHKVCGEYISQESRKFLESCGIPLDDWGLPCINTLSISDTYGNGYSFQLPLGGFGVSRFKLDNVLYEKAVKKGVTVITDCKVNDILFVEDHFLIQTKGATYITKLAAGCFGKRSNIDIKWAREFTKSKPGKLNNYIGVKYHIRYNHPSDTIVLHNFKDGYCGMSRVEDGISCLCYLTTAENLRLSGNSIPVMEETILAKNPLLKKIFNEAGHLYPGPITISQVSFQYKKQIENHVIMLGDAAGMITPLCGNGMSMAMHSAKIAFENIQLFLSRKISRAELEKQYTKQWQAHFAMRTRVGRWVQSLFGGHTTTFLFLKLMHRFPILAKKLISLTHGKEF